MSDLDDLMNLDPHDLTDEDIDKIIANHRKQRALAAQGVKPKKESGPKVDISHLLNKITLKETGDLPAEKPKVNRRF